MKSRVPTIINNAITNQIDPLLSKLTSNQIAEVTPELGPEGSKYVVFLNTTEVPKFYMESHEELVMKVDLTLQNEVTNATNPEIEDESLVEEHQYLEKANVTMAMSSNMINTILWLIEDAKLLYLEVTQDTLGPDPLISLTTKDLAILIPDMNKVWPGKGIFWVKFRCGFDCRTE